MKTKVLVVEDEVIIADNLCETLQLLGYEVAEPALGYAEAVDFLNNNPVDIVILDINLGTKKNGIDLAEYIRDHFNIPYLFLSSHSDQKTLELAKTAMPYAYLVKPFESADVLTSVEIALNNHLRYNPKNEEATTYNAPDFTAMEKVIIRMVSEKKTTRQIADILFISQSTVKNHRHNICVKLDLPPGTHSLLKWAMENKQLLN